MNTIASTSAYTLIVGADTLMAKAYALDLAQNKHNLLLIGKPHTGLMDWVQQLMTYDVEVYFFETDLTDQQNLELLADWIHSSYPISQFLNLADISWMGELFAPIAVPEKNVA